MAEFKSGTTIAGNIVWHAGNLDINSYLVDYVKIAGSEMSGNIGRTVHTSGHLVGGHNNIGSTAATTNPIYSIGSSYLPLETTLANHYGIGYASAALASYLSVFTAGSPTWGMYVSSDGDARIFLSAAQGTIYATSNMYINNLPVATQSWVTANFSNNAGTVTSVTAANAAHLTIANQTTTPVITVVSAPKWTTARTIALDGDVTGSTTIDGSANVTITTTLNAADTSKWTESSGKLYPKTITNLVGLGTVTPDSYLHIQTSTVGELIAIHLEKPIINPNIDGPILAFSYNEEASSPVEAGDNTGMIGFRASYASGLYSGWGAAIKSAASGTQSVSGSGGELTFWTTNDLTTTLDQRMIIDDAGNVGIGDTTPSDKLDVGGAIRLSGHTAWAAGTGPRIYKSDTHGTTIVGSSGTSYDYTVTNPVGNVMIQIPAGTADVILCGGGGGDVGIGAETSPAYQLDVTGTGRFTGNLDANSNLDVTGEIEFGANTGRFYAAGGIAVILNKTNTGALQLSGGNSTAVGANITLWGGVHISDADKYRLRISGSTVHTVTATQTQISNLGTGADGDLVVTSLSGVLRTRDIDDLIIEGSYWERDSINGYVYPKTLTDKVGINTTIPSITQLDVKGGIKYQDVIPYAGVSYMQDPITSSSMTVADITAMTGVTFALSGGETYYPNVKAETDFPGMDSGETWTYAEVLEKVSSVGGRLPTLAEVQAGMGEGTGGSYDQEWIWTSTPAGYNQIYVCAGNYTTYGEPGDKTKYTKAVDITDVGEKYRVRVTANVSKANLPVYFDNDSAIRTKNIIAEWTDGINIGDKDGLGIFVQDGGNVGIGNTTNTYKLDVTGTGRFTSDVDIQGELQVTGKTYLSNLGYEMAVVGGDNYHVKKIYIGASDGFIIRLGEWRLGVGYTEEIQYTVNGRFLFSNASVNYGSRTMFDVDYRDGYATIYQHATSYELGSTQYNSIRLVYFDYEGKTWIGITQTGSSAHTYDECTFEGRYLNAPLDIILESAITNQNDVTNDGTKATIASWNVSRGIFTNTVEHADGTADNHSATVGQLNTAVEADKFWLRDSGNGYLYPKTIGDTVGIGTVTPETKLHVYLGTSNLTPVLKIGPHDETTGLWLGNTTSSGFVPFIKGLAFDDTDVGLYMVASVASSNSTASAFYLSGRNKLGTTLASTKKVLQVANYTTELFTILGSGNVGIGIASPIYKLDVAGDVGISSTLVVDGTTTLNSTLTVNATSNLNGATVIKAAGTITQFQIEAQNSGSVYALMRFKPYTDEQIYFIGYGSTHAEAGKFSIKAGQSYGRIGFFTGGTAYPANETLSVASDGNVGIGQVTPIYKLDVTGDGRFTDTITMQVSEGTMQLGGGFITNYRGLYDNNNSSMIAGVDESSNFRYGSDGAFGSDGGLWISGSSAQFGGTLLVNTISKSGTSSDPILVSRGGEIQYRTAAEIVDEGGGESSPPSAPGTLTLTEYPSYVNIAFAANVAYDYYEIYSSETSAIAGFSLIGKVPKDFITATINFLDNSYEIKGQVWYNVYAYNHGLISAASSGTITTVQDVPDVTDVTLISDANVAHITWTNPIDRRLDSVQVKIDYNVTELSLSEGTASLIYQGTGQAFNTVISSADKDKFMKVWVNAITKT